jgi:hypothetical protein
VTETTASPQEHSPPDTSVVRPEWLLDQWWRNSEACAHKVVKIRLGGPIIATVCDYRLLFRPWSAAVVVSLVVVATLTTASTAAHADASPSDPSSFTTAPPNTPPGPGCATLRAQNVPHPWLPVTANANASLGQLAFQEGRTYTFPPGEVIYVPCNGFRLVGSENVTAPSTTINGNGDTFVDYGNYPASAACTTKGERPSPSSAVRT